MAKGQLQGWSLIENSFSDLKWISMVLVLEVLSGPLQGKKFKAEQGLTVGRRDTTILLDEDGKVSGLHAKIEADNKGQLVLMDQNSSNGLVINDRRVKKVALMRGVRFRVGGTLILISESEEYEAPTPAMKKPWRDEVLSLLTADPATNRILEGAPLPFTPAVQLEFLQGLQSETIFTLGYGPRSAGSGSLDMDLQDPDAPEVAFEIHPGPGTALFRDRSQGKIRGEPATAVAGSSSS